MANRILIVTDSSDLHADEVSAILASRGHPSFRINLDAFPRDYQICQQWHPPRLQHEIRHLPSGDCLDLNDVGAVWTRKAAEFSFISEDLGVQELAYAKLEAEHALFGLLYNLNCYWMSHPLALRSAMWKGEQLQRAMQMGFRVPASIVTNAPERVRSFQKQVAKPMIFKSMATAHLGAESVAQEDCVAPGLSTTLITDDMLEDLEAVRELPCHFQEYIPKLYELRVTVIGEHVFAAKIHSQDDARTRIDSRDISAEIPYEACQLPTEIRQRCLDFMASYGLQFSAFDLIVTPGQEYVFLENNPVGQFLYVEQLIPEFKMLETLANTLIEGAACSQTNSLS